MTNLDLPLADDAFRSAKHFARHMLKDGSLLLQPIREAIWTAGGHKDVGGQKMFTCVLFRSGCWQVELLVIHPGSSSPLHRHNHCESADVLLNGDLAGTVDALSIKRPRGNKLVANITCLPIGAWHGGATETGLVALSFQRWVGMNPTFIAEDWESFDGQ
jgi:hypothetical protein